jgi:hypothetical protein
LRFGGLDYAGRWAGKVTEAIEIRGLYGGVDRSGSWCRNVDGRRERERIVEPLACREHVGISGRQLKSDKESTVFLSDHDLSVAIAGVVGHVRKILDRGRGRR